MMAAQRSMYSLTCQLALCTGICPANQVTCIVVDECHKATGKADIVLAIRKMANDCLKFRVLGLSATPGKDRKAIQVCPGRQLIVENPLPRPLGLICLPLSAIPEVAAGMQEVVTNLMTARIEVREEGHPDVVKHVHQRHVQVVVVPLSNGPIAEARASLLHVLRDIINRLVSLRVSLDLSTDKNYGWDILFS